MEGDLSSSLRRSCRIRDFYPRPPGGGRHIPKANQANGNRISIHALRVEGDCEHYRAALHGDGFLSTPSGWRATWIAFIRMDFLQRFLSTPSGWRATRHKIMYECRHTLISIHALRVEGDACNIRGRCISTDFYPRPPGGGRLVSAGDGGSVAVFLSTPSGWRATAFFLNGFSHVAVFLSTPSGWRATRNGEIS